MTSGIGYWAELEQAWKADIYYTENDFVTED